MKIRDASAAVTIQARNIEAWKGVLHAIATVLADDGLRLLVFERAGRSVHPDHPALFLLLADALSK